MKKAIIIGSGAIGLCTAYYLNKKGYSVEIITSSKENEENDCSYGNAGMIVPSHFIPLAAPGVIMQGVKWMFNSKSPFYIKPRFDIDLIKWLIDFYNSSNQENVNKYKHLLKNLHLESKLLFENIQKDEELKFGYKKQGLMMLYKSFKHQDMEEKMAIEAISLGLDVEIKSKYNLTSVVEELAPNVLGGVLYKSDAHLNPNTFMSEIKKTLISKGVKIKYSTTIKGFETSDSKINAVITDNEKIEAEEIVICAGVWSEEIVKSLKIKIPLQGGKGYSMTIKKVPRNLIYPSILCEARVAMTPMGNDLRVAGTMEIAGNDLTIRKNRLLGIKEQVPKYFKNFDGKWFDKTKPWAGLRPVTPDGMPFIGRVSNWNNLSINTGHAMMGLSLAPISGKIMADIIVNEQLDFDISSLKPERF